MSFDDDGGAGSDSQIIYGLPPGTYTVEATTFPLNTTGDFDLDIVATARCVESLGTLSGTVTRADSWDTDCDSVNRPGRYALYYSFSIDSESEVQIDLESSTDTYLFLLDGYGTVGGVEASNDDVASGDYDSQIIADLAAGTYTVEATTYSSGATGSFTLTLTLPGTPTCIQDLGTISGTGDLISGTLTTGCDSVSSSGRYALFYTFTLGANSDVQIDMISTSMNTFLYLLEGSGTDGDRITNGYDGAGGTNARITRELEAGTYTVEATTWPAGLTGDFTLQISTITLTAGLLPPTNLNISFASILDDDLRISYSMGSHADSYRFEIQRKSRSGDEFVYHRQHNIYFDVFDYPTTTTASLVRQGYWYRARARACDYSLDECGEWGAWSSTLEPPISVHNFEPSPLALGGMSDIWTVPDGVTDIYAGVFFWQGEALDSTAGRFRLHRVTSTGDMWNPPTTFVIQGVDDSGEIANAQAGWHLRLDIDKDAFDTDTDDQTGDLQDLVRLTFHASSDNAGPRIASAEVRTESRPSAPTTGSAASDSATGGIQLSWSAGATRSGALPDHYEVVVPDPSDSDADPVHTNSDVSGTSLAISTEDLAPGDYTAQVRHCNAAGGCSAALEIAFVMPAALFQFTPDPLTLGTTSDSDNLWTVPWWVSEVYVNVTFDPDTSVLLDPGDININRVSETGDSIEILSSFVVDDRDDDGGLSGAGPGSLVQIQVDPDAFRSDKPEVTLSFYSGSDASGDKIAEATVETQAKPGAPTAGSVTVDGDNGKVLLTWTAGDNANADPDNYRVVVPDADNEGMYHYSSPEIDDSLITTEFEIENAWDELPVGRHTVEVRHCNSVGGCSEPLSMTFDMPFLITPRPVPLGTDSDNWTVPSGVTQVFLEVEYGTAASSDIGAGIITIVLVPQAGDTQTIHDVTAETSDGILTYQPSGGTTTNVQDGDVLQVSVDEDAFDLNHPLVSLTFHSGADASGVALAQATVQKEAQPASPINGTATMNRAEDSVTFVWQQGIARAGSVPDHYRVAVLNSAINETTTATQLTIMTARTDPGLGSHTAEVRHCNVNGGCSDVLSIGFTVLPPPEEAVITDLGPGSLEVGAQDVFSVQISNLLPSVTYGLTVETNGPHGTFDAACSDMSESVSNMTGPNAFGPLFTLHGCQVGVSRVTATLTGISPTVSSYQDVDIVPPADLPPPANLQIAVNPDENKQLDVTYDPGVYPLFLHFELQKSDTQAGPYVPYKTSVSHSGPVAFSEVEIGYWYKVQARNCDSASASSGSGWSGCGTVVAFSAPLLLRLFQPMGLDVTPLPKRMAELTWLPVEYASGYELQTQRTGGGWSPVYVSQLAPTTAPAVELALDGLISVSAGNSTIDIGLAYPPYSYDFRVVATHATSATPPAPMPTGNSGPSQAVTIIDNPLLQEQGSANGISTAGNGQADLAWMPISDVREYTIRYRKLGVTPSEGWLGRQSVPHTSKYWYDHDDWPYYEETHEEQFLATPGNASKLISGLTVGELYAFQINYETNTGQRVFSARDMYVYPAAGFPPQTLGADRVATFPMFGHWPSKEYTYSICEVTFTAPVRVQWTHLIKHSFEQWEAATGIVEVTPSPTPCTVDVNIPFSMVSSYKNDINEVLMIPNSALNASLFSGHFLDNYLAQCVRFAPACVISEAYTSDEDASTDLGTEPVDVLVSESNLVLETWYPGTPPGAPVVYPPGLYSFIPGADYVFHTDDVRFNTCVTPAGQYPGYGPYTTMLHEAGHALGLSGFDAGSLFPPRLAYETSHPTIYDSVMNYDEQLRNNIDPNDKEKLLLYEPDCSPNAFDIMAICALYQTLP